MNRPLCIHCELRKPNSTRGLCRACTDTPGVREMYPCQSKKAHLHRNGLGITGTSKLPRRPTKAPVGSTAKMKVMQERASAGVSLFHPRDSREVQPCPREHYLTTRRRNSTARQA